MNRVFKRLPWWQASFRRQFEAGLETWSDAEDRFVAQRLKWETNAQKAYISAEESWDRAFGDFDKKRKEWFTRMNRILAAAGRSWNTTISSFEKDIKSELDSLKAAQDKEQAVRRKEANTYLTAFQQTSGVLTMAEKNVTYLEERRDSILEKESENVRKIQGWNSTITILQEPVNQAQSDIETQQALIAELSKERNELISRRNALNKPGYNRWPNYYINNTDYTSQPKIVTQKDIDRVNSSLSFAHLRLDAAKGLKSAAIAAVAGEVANLRAAIKNTEKDLDNPELPLIQDELKYWQDIKVRFSALRDKARREVLTFVNRMNGNLSGTGSAEKEKHRLTELIAMLEDEESIARAVNAYAEDTTSNRPTRAETAKSLEAAQKELRNAQNTYQQAIGELDRITKEELSNSRAGVENRQKELAEAHGRLSDAKQKLQNAMAAYRLNDAGAYENLIEKIDEASKKFLNTEKNGTEDDTNEEDYQDLMNGYFKAAWRTFIVGAVAAGKTMETQLKEGSSTLGIPSFAELENYHSKLQALNLSDFNPDETSAAEFETAVLTTLNTDNADPNVISLKRAYAALGNASGEYARSTARLGLNAVYRKLLFQTEYSITVRRRALEMLGGRYASNGSLLDEGDAPVILRPEDAAELERSIERSATETQLNYRRALLRKQLEVNKGLSDAAAAETAWIAQLQGEASRTALEAQAVKDKTDAASNAIKAEAVKAARALQDAQDASKRPTAALVQKLNNEFKKDASPGRQLALALYLDRKRALSPQAIGIIRSAYDTLKGIDGAEASAASMKAALESDAVKAAEAHGGQFVVGDANLLDDLVTAEKNAFTAAGAKRKALNQYGHQSYAWLEKRLRSRITAIKTAMKTFTEAVDGSAGSGRSIRSDTFAEAYTSLIAAQAPNSVIEMIGMYARALGAEGRLTALDEREIAEIEDKERADAHRRLAAYLADPGGGITLANLAGGELPEGTQQPNALTAGLYREMLDAAVSAVTLDGNFRTAHLGDYKKRAQDMPEEQRQLGELRNKFLRAESGYRHNLTRRVAVGAERHTFVTSKSNHYDNIIGNLKKRIKELQNQVSAKEQVVSTALAAFTAAAARYEAQGRAVEAAEKDYEAARLALRTAEAINDYARSGAVETGSVPTPAEALTRTGTELSAAKTALGVITRLINSKATRAKRDAKYQTLLDKEVRQLQAVQELALVREKINADTAKLEGKIQSKKNEILKFIGKSGHYKDNEEWVKPDIAQIKAEWLNGRESEFRNYKGYFDGDTAKYSTDLASWILAVQKKDNGSEFMRKMAVGIMYELAAQPEDNLDEFRIEAGASGRVTDLIIGRMKKNSFLMTKDERKSFLDEKGKIRRHLRPHVVDGGLAQRLFTAATVKIQFIFTFFEIEYNKDIANRNLLSRAAAAYNEVKNEPEYHFFRLLMATGNHNGTLEQSVNDDIEHHAVQTMIQDGWYNYGRLQHPIFFSRERSTLSGAIRAMPRNSGGPERERFLAGGQFRKDVQSWNDHNREFDALNKTAPDMTSVEKAIRDREGAFTPGVEAAVRYILDKGTAGEKASIAAVVEAASGRLNRMLGETNQGLARRAFQLNRKAQELESRYLQTLDRFLEGKASRDELTTAAEARYSAPSYDALDSLEVRIKNARGVRTHPAGELEQLKILVHRALAAAAHTDNDFRLRVKHRYDMDRRQLNRSLDRRNIEIRNLIVQARTEWRTSRTRLEGMRIRWRRDTKERYEDSSELWDLRHAQLAAGREKWLEESTRAGMIAGSRAVAVQWDIEAKTLIADAESAVIPSLSIDTPSLSKLVEDAAGGTVLDALIERAGRMTPRGSDTAMVVAAYLPSLNVNAAKASVARSITQSLFDQVTERAAVLTAIQAREQFEKQLKGMEKGIDDANRNFENRLANQMESAGYQLEGGLWRRSSIIGSTLFGGEEWEDQHVSTYRYFTSPGFRGRTDLSNEALKGLSGQAIFTLVEKASEEMTRYQVLIFGRSDKQRKEKTEDGKPNEKYVKPADADEFNDTLKQILKDATAGWERGAGYLRRDKKNELENKNTEGLFNFHVGYQPVMNVENKKYEEVKEAGYGQLGIIMSQFMINEARMGRGNAALKAPIYRKPFWDDDADNDGKPDGIFPAPNLMMPVSIVYDITAGIAGAAMTAIAGNVAGAAVSTAIGLIDDLIFTTLDISTGYRKAEDAWKDFGVKAATSALANLTTAGLSSIGNAGASLFSGAASTATNTAVNSGTSAIAAAMGRGLKAMGQGAVIKLANTAITTAAYGKHGSFEDFLNDYGNKLGRFDTWSGVLASGIRGFTQGMLAGNDFAGFSSEDIDHVNAVAGFGANMAAGGFEFATTGRTTFNILQFKDVGTAALTFDINEGVSAELFSQGGHQLNFSAAMKGLGTFAFNNAVRRYERTGKMDILKGYRGTTDAGAALRSNYSFGDDNARSQAWSIAREDTLLRVGGRLSDDGDKNHLGVTTVENGRRVVHLSTLGRKGDIASQLQAGTVLQWEAHRDGLNNGFEGQWGETMNAAAGMAEMAYNLAVSRRYGRDFRINGQQAAIMQAIAQGGIEGLAEHVAANYDFTSGDNWKLKSDGNIEWDGKRGLYDEEGNLIRLAVDENGLTLGYGESLLEYMGRKNAEAFLKSRGSTAAEKMTNSELGDALMGHTALEWTAAAGVPKDPNMADLLNNRTVGYRAARNSWVNTSYQYDSIRAKTLRTEFGTATPKFTASKDVMKQVAMRNRILSDMAAYAHAVQGGYMSPGSLSHVAADIRQRQGQYNRRYVKSGLAFTPENYMSQKFANKASRLALTNGSYLTYTHAGIDTVGSNRVVSPGFTERFAIPSRFKKSHAIELSLIGMDINFRGLHMNPDQMKTIAVGMQFNPGGFIGNYGKWGGITGPHLHLEATRLNGAGRRGFVNGAALGIDSWRPGSDFGGYHEYKKDGEYIKKEKGSWSSIWPR